MILIDRSLDCEMTMPLRAPSELSDSLHIHIFFVSSFDDEFDEDNDVFPPPLLLLILRMFFLLLKF